MLVGQLGEAAAQGLKRGRHFVRVTYELKLVTFNVKLVCSA